VPVLLHDPSFNGCGSILGPDQPLMQPQFALVAHIGNDPGMGFLLVSETAIEDRLQGVQFGLSVLVQNLGLGQFCQFVEPFGLFLRQLALDRIDAPQCGSGLVVDPRRIDRLDPFPAFGGGCGLGRQLLRKEAGQQFTVLQQRRVGKEVSCHASACGAVGIDPDKTGAAVSCGINRFGLQKLLETMLAHFAPSGLFQHGQGKGFVVRDGERLGRAQSDFTCFQRVQHRGGQGGKGEAAIDMGLGRAEGAGDGRYISAAVAHPAIGADFVGGVQVLAGSVLDGSPCASGGLVRGQPDRHKGEFGPMRDKFGVAFERQLDRAPAATSSDDTDLALRVAQTGERLDQADHGNAIGHERDALWVGLLPGVHVGKVKVGQRQGLDAGGLDGAGVTCEGGYIGHG